MLAFRIVALGAVVASIGFAGTVFYTSQSAFLADAGRGLVFEGFENGVLAPDGIVDSGLTVIDATTSNAYFAAGAIVNGLRVSAGSASFYLSNGFFRNPTLAPFTSSIGDSITISFAGGTRAAGMFFYSGFSEAPPSPLTAYDRDGNVLFTTDQFSLYSIGVFAGWVSDVPIDHVSMHLVGTEGLFGVDNIQFAPPAATDVPEPGGAALAGLGLGAALASVVIRRRVKVRGRL